MVVKWKWWALLIILFIDMVLIGNHNQFVDSLCAFVVKGHWGDLSKVKNVSALTSSTIHQVLLQLSLYGYGLSYSFPFFKWLDSIPHYSHSLQCSWAMIHILTEHKHFKTAQHMLEKIAHKDFLSSPSVLTTLVRTHDNQEVNSQVLSWLVIHYAKSKMTQDAIQVFEQMRLHEVKPHLHACTVLLNSLLKDGVTHMVWKIYKKMVQVGVVPNTYIYNCLFHACSKAGDVERAECIQFGLWFIPDNWWSRSRHGKKTRTRGYPPESVPTLMGNIRVDRVWVWVRVFPGNQKSGRVRVLSPQSLTPTPQHILIPVPDTRRV